MKAVLRKEDGKIYRSAKEAAEDTGVSVGMIVHVLKGRNKSAGGYTFSYSEKKPQKPPRPSKERAPRSTRPVYDEEGRMYPSIARLALAKGIPAWKAHYLIRRDGVLRFDQIRDVPHVRVECENRYGWRVNDRWFERRFDAAEYAKSLIPHMHPQRIYFALERDKAALYHAGKGWFVDTAGDLFAPIREDER